MPKFYEVYGQDLHDQSTDACHARRKAYCPFTQSTCDGGGNRHQTKIKLANSRLRDAFDTSLSSVIPGICSIQYGTETWVVCPRRLMGFSAAAEEVPSTNASLLAHERASLLQAGLPQGVELGVWPEVYLQYDSDDTSINYHFDFVIAPIRRHASFAWILGQHNISSASAIEELKAAAKAGGYLKGRYDAQKALDVLPDLVSPTIIEVMTASTSGSDKEAGTDIASAFTEAILGNDHNCPGINKRQVWGRMATQLFAKSALAEAWGGKTVWLVQDQLLKNIQRTTKLDVDAATTAHAGTINFLSMAYANKQKGIDALRAEKYSEISAGLDFNGSQTATDILLPKVYPDKTVLLKAILRRKLAAVLLL